MKLRDTVRIALFAALISVCAWLTVPGPVPFTMQTFAVFTAAGALGGRRGTLAVLLYILMGALGLPVFSGFRGGAGILLGCTGGYIAGFLLIPPAVSLVRRLMRDRMGSTALGMAAGLALCYGFGTGWYMLTCAGSSSAGALLSSCVLPFIIPDGVKIYLACVVTRRLEKADGGEGKS